MKRKFYEWLSLQRVKNPGGMVLGVILLFNIVLFIVSSAVISALSLEGTEQMGFMEAAFCTITMILDAGCIQFVISDIGESGVLISVFCLSVVVIGMISFTGALIGYVTNYISSFIDNANAGRHEMLISNHVVILNWNSRASEIVNDFLYSDKRQKIVVLVGSRKEEVAKEIEERIADTISRENKKIVKQYAHLPFLRRKMAIHKNRFRRNIDVVVREGDVFSSMQLRDICLDRARSIIILGNDINNTICKFEHKDRLDARSQGNSQTVKTLMQVADITSAEASVDNQKIIVEVTDDWTWELVQKIIRSKQVDGECDIVPVRVNQVLGQILSQFSLMPELNTAYSELFSNQGAEFYSAKQPPMDMAVYAKRYLKNNRHAIPLAFMKNKNDTYCYYMAGCPSDVQKAVPMGSTPKYAVKLNHDYWVEQKSVIILGHNSKSRDIMQGFRSFCDEWNRNGQQIVHIVVIDDQKSLDKMDNYRDYPFVVKTVAADIYNEELICSTIEEVVSASVEDTSILVLSDDSVLNEDIDANALANLIYVQEIINRKKQEPGYRPGSIDVIVEIIDPKHHDIVNSYSVNNVVISNRYVSKMIAQIGEVDALFNFYADILSYADDDENSAGKEIYLKKVSAFFAEPPAPCTAAELIRAVLNASTDESLPPEKRDPAFVLGYVRADGEMILFEGDQTEIRVELQPDDKMLVFCSH